MFSGLKRFATCASAALLFTVCTVPTPMTAQQHLVGPSDLQQQAVTATQTRQQNVEALTRAFSTPQAEKALKAANVDSARVKTAIATLSDSDLQQLAARTTHAQSDFAAGRIPDRDLLIILVAVAVLILIIVAVHH